MHFEGEVEAEPQLPAWGEDWGDRYAPWDGGQVKVHPFNYPGEGFYRKCGL